MRIRRVAAWGRVGPRSVVAWGVVFAFGLLSGCATRSRKEAHEPAPSPEPYVRVSTGDSNVVALQIAMREFVPKRGKGPLVWLAAVSHIGESNYYAALQKQL